MDHEITVKRLKELLAQLDDDDVLIPNKVRNLSVYRRADNGGRYLGFIDLLKDTTSVVFQEVQ